MAYRSKESLLKSGYQSMDTDDEDLEFDDETLTLFVKIVSEDEVYIMYYYVKDDKVIWQYPKKVYLEDILLYNRMWDFLKSKPLK